MLCQAPHVARKRQWRRRSVTSRRVRRVLLEQGQAVGVGAGRGRNDQGQAGPSQRTRSDTFGSLVDGADPSAVNTSGASVYKASPCLPVAGILGVDAGVIPVGQPLSPPAWNRGRNGRRAGNGVRFDSHRCSTRLAPRRPSTCPCLHALSMESWKGLSPTALSGGASSGPPISCITRLEAIFPGP